MRGHRRIGKCIYCGEANGGLTDEHITPLALNGDKILIEASCETCRNITSHRGSKVWSLTELFLQRGRRCQQRPGDLAIDRGLVKCSWNATGRLKGLNSGGLLFSI